MSAYPGHYGNYPSLSSVLVELLLLSFYGFVVICEHVAVVYSFSA